MPKKVHDLAKKLQKQGKSESSAWAIANSVFNKKKEKKSGKVQRKEKGKG